MGRTFDGLRAPVPEGEGVIMVDQVIIPVGLAQPGQGPVGLGIGAGVDDSELLWLMEGATGVVEAIGAVDDDIDSVAVTGQMVVRSVTMTVGAGVGQFEGMVTVDVVGVGYGVMLLVPLGVLTEQVVLGAAVELVVLCWVAVTGQMVVVDVMTEVITFWVCVAGQFLIDAAQLVMV